MAQEFVGLEYVTNSFVSPTVATGVMPEGGNYKSDDVIVRVFKSPANGNYHLFVVNKHATNPASITGWENWTVANWGKISALHFASQNQIGSPWQRETIKTVYNPPPAPGAPLTIEPISVHHIELSATTNTLPVVFAQHQQDGKENPATAGLVRLTRVGSTNAPLSVRYAFAGTAALGSDFTVGNTNAVTIPTGRNYVDVELKPVTDTMWENQVEYATLIVRPSTNYIVGAPTSASIFITD
jgi:hypothetical protein